MFVLLVDLTQVIWVIICKNRNNPRYKLGRTQSSKDKQLKETKIESKNETKKNILTSTAKEERDLLFQLISIDREEGKVNNDIFSNFGVNSK